MGSCKIAHFLGALDKNLAKIVTEGFTKMQDSYQEFQEVSHCVLYCHLLIFRLILAIFLRYMSYNFNVIAHAGSLLDVKCQ